MKRFLSLVLIFILLATNLQVAFALEDVSNEITVNMDVDFEGESFTVGKLPPYGSETRFANDNGQGKMEVRESEGNKYLYLHGKKTTSTENPVIVMEDVFNSPVGSFKAKFRTEETFGRKAFFIRLSDGSKINILEFYGSKIYMLDKNTGLGVTAGTWYDIEFKYAVKSGKTEVEAYVNDNRVISTSLNNDVSNAKMDLRFHVLPTTSENSTFMIDDIYSWSPRELTCTLNTSSIAVDDSIVVKFSNVLKSHPEFLLNESADNIGNVEYNDENNSYRVYFNEYLQKNTNYILSVNNAEDNHGQVLSNVCMEFKTFNTSLVIANYSYDGSNIAFDVKNTGSQAEHAFIALCSYLDNKIDECTFIETDVAADSSAQVDFEFENSAGMLKKILVLNSRDNPATLVKKVIDGVEYGVGDFDYTYDTSVNIDENTGRVDIYGITDGENKDMSIIVNNPDGSVNYVDSIGISSDGKWSFTFVCDDISGNFTYTLSGFSDGSVASDGFRLVSLIDKNNFLRDINSVLSAVDVENYLSHYKEVLEFKFSLFDDVADKTTVYKNVSDYVASGNRFSQISDVTEFLKSSTVCQAVNEATSSAEVACIIENYDDIIKFKSSKAYTLYSLLSDDAQDKLLSNSLNIMFKDCEDINKYLSEQSVLKTIYTAKQYSEIQNVIENYFDVLEISLEEYNKLKTPSNIAKALLNNAEFESAAGFEEKFSELVSKQYQSETKPKEENKKPSQITIGGSSSGGGGSNNPIVQGGTTPVQPPILNNENETNKTNIDFSDVASDFWAKSAIVSLCSKGTISGYPDGSFRPDNKVTRAEFVKMLVGYLDIHDSNATSEFADVDDMAWYYSYVSSAVKAGIVTGNDNNEFLPNSEISRQDMTVMVYRSKKYWKEYKEAERNYIAFNDDSHISSYATEAVKALYNLGIINGDGNGAFLPFNSATRAEAAIMIYSIENN